MFCRDDSTALRRGSSAGAGIRPTRVLNPWASAANLYPRSAADVAEPIHLRLSFVPCSILTRSLLRRLVWQLRSAGANHRLIGVRRAR